MRVSACALVLCVVGTPGIAAAQSAQAKADAEALFNAGRSALNAGSYAEACPKLAESEKLDPAIGTSLYLAECYERSGKIASAWAEFRQAEEMARQRGDARAAIAKTRGEQLTPSKLVVVLAPGADMPGLEVRRDGQVLSSALYGLPSPIDGGRHVIVASAPGRRAFEWAGDIPVQQGAVTVTIPKLEPAPQTPLATVTTPPVPTVSTTAVVPPPVVTAPSERPSAGLGGGKIAGLVIGGIGLVAVGVGTTLGLVAKSNYDATTPNDNCTTAGCPTQQGVSDRNAAKGLADASTGIFIGGAVLAAAGLVMFFVMPRPKATSTALTVAPLVGSNAAGAVLSGRF